MFIISIFSDRSKEMTAIDSWGPKTWNFLHAIALTYPLKAEAAKKDSMIQMLSSLKGLIPCDKCVSHYTDWFNTTRTSDKAFEGRESLFNALVELHNKVNETNGKGRVSEIQAHRIHGNFPPSGSVCPSSASNIHLVDSSMYERRFFFIAIVVCVVVGILAHRRRQRNNEMRVD